MPSSLFPGLRQLPLQHPSPRAKLVPVEVGGVQVARRAAAGAGWYRERLAPVQDGPVVHHQDVAWGGRRDEAWNEVMNYQMSE